MKPILGITMGDPSGNGPEITIKALMKPEIYERCRPVVIGDAVCMEAAASMVEGAYGFRIHAIRKVEDAVFAFGTIDVLDMGLVDVSKRLYMKDWKEIEEEVGEEAVKKAYLESHRMCGEAAFQYVKKVIQLAMDGTVDATVTNALNKDYINLAGHHYSGHTEIYADYTGTSHYTMMLAHENLRVVHVSTHVSLREACDRVK